MDLGFGDGPELKITRIAPKKKRASIDTNDSRIADVNAESGFSHPTEQAQRKRGRPKVQAKAPKTKPMPMIDGIPANYPRPDDTNGCMTIHGPERVREGFEAIKVEHGNPPSWAVLTMLIQSYRDNEK